MMAGRAGIPKTGNHTGQDQGSRRHLSFLEKPRSLSLGGGEEGVLGDTDAENLGASLSMALCVS